MMRDILKDSKMIRDRSEHLYNPDNIDQEVFEDKVQEYYSLTMRYPDFGADI